MNYKSIKHSFLIILIATTIVGCAGNSVQPPASQHYPSSSTQNGESIVSRDDTSSIDVEDVDKEAITNQECRNLVMCLNPQPYAPVGFIYQAPSVGDMILLTLTSPIWARLALVLGH